MLVSACVFISACSTPTGRGLEAFNDHRALDAIPHLEGGVAEGDKVAAMLLTLIYLSDSQVPADLEKAKYYHKQFDQLEGSIYDQYVDFYIDYIQASILLKDDITTNDAQGVTLLRQSKYLNYSPVLALLAESYCKGKGVNKNYRLSHKLFARSIHYGNKVQASLGYAWTLATHEDAEFSKGANPMDYMPKLEDVSEDYKFIYYDTLAAIHARKGKYRSAIKFQGLAIESIRKELSRHVNYKIWLEDYQSQLNALYNKESAAIPIPY